MCLNEYHTLTHSCERAFVYWIVNENRYTQTQMKIKKRERKRARETSERRQLVTITSNETHQWNNFKCSRNQLSYNFYFISFFSFFHFNQQLCEIFQTVVSLCINAHKFCEFVRCVDWKSSTELKYEISNWQQIPEVWFHFDDFIDDFLEFPLLREGERTRKT